MSDADRILVARIAGTATRHARTREWTAGKEAAAVADLHELAGGRPDLLAEEAGIALAVSLGRLDEEWCRRIAHLCIAAGADEAAIPRWIEVGLRRAEAAEQVPYTGTATPD